MMNYIAITYKADVNHTLFLLGWFQRQMPCSSAMQHGEAPYKYLLTPRLHPAQTITLHLCLGLAIRGCKCLAMW
jgi:hypothetical protein